jgi:hypothetical protein
VKYFIKNKDGSTCTVYKVDKYKEEVERAAAELKQISREYKEKMKIIFAEKEKEKEKSNKKKQQLSEESTVIFLNNIPYIEK